MSIPYRQVHLDFHTSEFIPSVKLDAPEEFAKILDEARVNSITCFARCHHGWLYYQSKSHPELTHPHLDSPNLLIDQIDACHAKGIRVPVYTTVQWDGRVMREHPEWLARDSQGEVLHTYVVEEPHFYDMICVNSGYREFLFQHVQDIINSVGVDRLDGLFFDILQVIPCQCSSCRKGMKELGLTGIDGAWAYGKITLDNFKKEMSDFIRSQCDISIFYNGSHIAPSIKRSLDTYSHIEIESLPSGSWGYDHFPVVSRYARTLGKDVIGMTGKFHTFWGDFHSLKNKAALEFECFMMLAQGCGCSVGDQLHPSMGLSSGAYKLIGSVYKSVEEKEPWCINSSSVSEIGVMNLDEWRDVNESSISPSLIGAVRMLQELSYQFDLVDRESDFSRYQLLILPDEVPWSEQLEKSLLDYVAQGGSLIGSWQSLVMHDKESPLYGMVPQGESSYHREFVKPNRIIGKTLSDEPYVMYHGGIQVESSGGKVLMETVFPYFNREGETFCSHQHAPVNPSSIRTPAVVQHGQVLYFSHPIFRLYRKNGAHWCKSMIKDGIDLFLEKKQMITHTGPSSLVSSLRHQEIEQRVILHLLHYIPEKRTEDLFVIEDVIPLHDIEVTVDLSEILNPCSLSAIRVVPSQDDLAWLEREGSKVIFTIPKIEGHAMIELSYRG